jgi:uncharacterized repeat protein (TIGR01451 family)
VPDVFTQARSGGTVTETASANIASGSSDVFTLVVAAPASLANGANFSDTATVSASNPDTNTTNDTATVTGSVVNNSPNADLAVTAAGPSSSTEGNTVTYTLTVTNAGPSSAASTTLTDTLPSILTFKSATITQGTFSHSGGVVTFSIGTLAAGGKVTATVVAVAAEDGSTSNTASVSSSNPDPNTANNTASVTTSFAEPAISVSGSIRTKNHTLTNFQTATFTHANGVEPASAFSATINWGDGTTSAGTITLSGTTYSVTGSHTYTSGGNHTISTSVKETGNSALPEGGNKLETDPGKLPLKQRDVVRAPFADDQGRRPRHPPRAAVVPPALPTRPPHPTDSAAPVILGSPTVSGQYGTAGAGALPTDSAVRVTDEFFSREGLVLYPPTSRRSASPAGWLADPGL